MSTAPMPVPDEVEIERYPPASLASKWDAARVLLSSLPAHLRAEGRWDLAEHVGRFAAGMRPAKELRL